MARWWSGRNDGLLLDRVSCSVLVTMGPETGADAAVVESSGVDETARSAA
jgi:hypothetical protein